MLQGVSKPITLSQLLQILGLCFLACSATYLLCMFTRRLQSFAAAESRQTAVALLKAVSCMLFLVLMWGAEVYVMLDLGSASDEGPDGAGAMRVAAAEVALRLDQHPAVVGDGAFEEPAAPPPRPREHR